MAGVVHGGHVDQFVRGQPHPDDRPAGADLPLGRRVDEAEPVDEVDAGQRVEDAVELGRVHVAPEGPARAVGAAGQRVQVGGHRGGTLPADLPRDGVVGQHPAAGDRGRGVLVPDDQPGGERDGHVRGPGRRGAGRPAGGVAPASRAGPRTVPGTRPAARSRPCGIGDDDHAEVSRRRHVVRRAPWPGRARFTQCARRTGVRDGSSAAQTPVSRDTASSAVTTRHGARSAAEGVAHRGVEVGRARPARPVEQREERVGAVGRQLVGLVDEHLGQPARTARRG